MKKIVYGILATLSGLVLLFSYKTSWNDAAVAAADAGAISSGTATTDTSGTATTDSSSSATATDDSDEGEDDDDHEDDEEDGDDSDDSSSGTSTSSGSSSSSSSSGSTSTSAALTDGTYAGAAANTRYGAVQVTITVSGGTITSIDVPQYPSSDRRDLEINQRALPVLIDETISAQSSSISMVSGATYTSRGYIQSLQSAIDQAAG